MPSSLTASVSNGDRSSTTPDRNRVLRLQEVSRRFGATLALHRVSLDLQAGAVTVLRGHNGSGKSTLLNLACQILRPTSGRLMFAGRPLSPRAGWYRSTLGVVSHHSMLYHDLSGRENLLWTARAYGLSDSERKVEALCGRLHVGRYLDRPVRTYSRGQLQRVALVRALLHDPDVLVLDEPATGLDDQGLEDLATLVRAERARGALVLLVTHDGAFGAALADRTIQLERGRVVADFARGEGA